MGKHKAFIHAHWRKRVYVEHTIGLLKERWLILKHGSAHDVEMVNKIILWCCGLHNYLWDCNHGDTSIQSYRMSSWARRNMVTEIETMQDYISDGLVR